MRNNLRDEDIQKPSDDFTSLEISTDLTEDDAGNDTLLTTEPEDKEVLGAFNSTFEEGNNDVLYSDSLTVGGPAINTTTPSKTTHYTIGSVRQKDGGKIIKYDIDPEMLWKHVLRIIHHRISVSSGHACLLNVRTISRQITRECNIKSIAAVERESIRLLRERFGVKDPIIEKEERGLKRLRGTIEFWGTVGGRTANNRKRVARVYQVLNGKKLMKYVEGEIDLDKFKGTNREEGK